MRKVTLGNTGITVNKNGFGGLPLQRVGEREAIRLICSAVEGGVQLIDTARNYTDSEIKIGKALRESGFRDRVTLCTKSYALDRAQLDRELKQSLEYLQTDHIDLYQFHNLKLCPKPGDGTELYEGMIKAKEAGLIGHIGITTHRREVALEALESGLYETIQYPFCYLAAEEDFALVRACAEKGIGFIAMKGLSGGLITNAAAAYAFMAQFDNVLPIWGIQKQNELEEFLRFQEAEPVLTPELQAVIDADRRELTGEFCRGCGYCLPCPENIPINIAVRMSWFLRRMPSEPYRGQDWQEKMACIERCTNCRSCAQRCPYELDIPALLQKNLQQYREFLEGKS